MSGRACGHQGTHIHAGGWLSGVFYLKTVQEPIENEGAIEFGLDGYEYEEDGDNLPKILYEPQQGDMVLFPSSLFHRTLPITSQSERWVIAFDLIPKKYQGKNYGSAKFRTS